MMRRSRHKQRDLFEEATRTMNLQPEMRAKLTPLLQILLAEAADIVPHDTEAGVPIDKENGDDQDHA
jgi:hypothetical protein